MVLDFGRREKYSSPDTHQGILSLNYRIGREVETIIEPIDTGFSCPGCGNTIETNYCQNCKCFISPTGEMILNGNEEPIEHVPEDIKKKKKKDLQGVDYEYSGKSFTLFGAKNLENDKLTVHIGYQYREYKITFTPWKDKMVKSISEKSKGKFKKKRVATDIFHALRDILSELSRNPDKYGLSECKVFKK